MNVCRAANVVAKSGCRNASNLIMKTSPIGLGGRSSNMSDLCVTVFGSYGFVGRYFMNELGSHGVRTYAPFRGDEMEVRHLKPMYDLGQLGLLPFSPRDKDSIREAMKYSDVVVNLIGKHYETKNILPTKRANGEWSRVNYSFDEVHHTLPETLAELAKEAGAQGFIQVSALTASEDAASQWSRSKALGDAAVRKAFPDAVIVKLASVFGPEDRFLNPIAEFSSRFHFYPMLNNGETLFQPVHVGDVARGLFEILKRYDEFCGKTFEFAGSEEYTYKEIAEYVHDVTLMDSELIPFSSDLAQKVGRLAGEMINPIWTDDMAAQLAENSIKSGAHDGLEALGVVPQLLDQTAFDYLHRFRRGGHFTLVKGYH